MVKLGENNEYEIVKQDGKYTFTVNGQFATVIEAGCNRTQTGYMLYPYFGGDETAPHKITTVIRESEEKYRSKQNATLDWNYVLFKAISIDLNQVVRIQFAHSMRVFLLFSQERISSA